MTNTDTYTTSYSRVFFYNGGSYFDDKNDVINIGEWIDGAPSRFTLRQTPADIYRLLMIAERIASAIEDSGASRTGFGNGGAAAVNGVIKRIHKLHYDKLAEGKRDDIARQDAELSKLFSGNIPDYYKLPSVFEAELEAKYGIEFPPKSSLG